MNFEWLLCINIGSSIVKKNKCALLMRDVGNGRGYACMGDFPGDTSYKKSCLPTLNATIPGSGKSPRGRHGNLTAVFMPGESHRQKSLAGYTSIGWQRVGQNWRDCVHTLAQACAALSLRGTGSIWKISVWSCCKPKTALVKLSLS